MVSRSYTVKRSVLKCPIPLLQDTGNICFLRNELLRGEYSDNVPIDSATHLDTAILFQFIISIVSLPLAGRYLERIWGPVELLRFSLITIVISNIIAWFLALVLFAVTRGEQQMCVHQRDTRVSLLLMLLLPQVWNSVPRTGSTPDWIPCRTGSINSRASSSVQKRRQGPGS
jgi:hypothetical protein